MSAGISLLDTEVEQDLRSSVRDLLERRCQPTAVAAIYDGDRSVVAGLWRSLASGLDLAGLLVPEERGGVGASAREAAVVLEELGRAVAPVPFLTSAVIATTALLATESDAGDELLRALASGEKTAALAVAWSASPYRGVPAITADSEGRLRGTVTSVAGAREADVVLVPVAVSSGVALYAAPASSVSLTPVVSLDMSRELADITFDGAGGELVVADGESAVRNALAVGAALLASEQVGLAQWCLTTTVAYLKERRQFGRVVGGFQALKHRFADLYTEVESASAAARYAAVTVAAGDDDRAVATAVAQSYCSDVAVHAAEEAIQLHGGIGMTWEHPAHLYLKRAKADQIALGTAEAHRAHLAGLVNLTA